MRQGSLDPARSEAGVRPLEEDSVDDSGAIAEPNGYVMAALVVDC